MIDIEKEYLDLIKSILKEIVPDCRVWVFGSRINDKSRKYSDVDLVVKGNGVLDFQIIEKLKDAFSESNLPMIVDILDWNRTSDDFKKIIKEGYEVIQ